MNRILIVEDNPNTREMLQRHLTKAGYEVFEAENGEVALAQIKRDLPDLVLLDVTMPGMSGFEVCHKLRNTPQSELVYIIMVTAVAGIEQRIHGLDTGANDYVTKPFDIEELLARIRVALRTVTEKRDAVLDPLTKLYNKSFFS